MTVNHQLETNQANQELWIELNDQQSDEINGGGTNINTNININVLTNIAVQTNIATIIGANGSIGQYNYFRR
jgi:hypothetical protein